MLFSDLELFGAEQTDLFDVPAAVETREQPRSYRDMGQVGEWFGVEAATVSKWRERYADSHPCPVPDVVVGRTPGWADSREDEWRRWETSRPGRGAGGGRPRRQALSS